VGWLSSRNDDSAVVQHGVRGREDLEHERKEMSDEQAVVYYLGGPWDLHKVAANPRTLGDRVLVREAKPNYFPNPATELIVTDHTYIIRPVAEGVFVAVHDSGRR
jgi:hypothetical protein